MNRIAITGIAISACLASFAQTPVSKTEKNKTLLELGKTLSENYYSAEAGKTLGKASCSGKYDKIASTATGLQIRTIR